MFSFRVFAVAANLQKILDNDQITSLTFALVSFTEYMTVHAYHWVNRSLLKVVNLVLQLSELRLQSERDSRRQGAHRLRSNQSGWLCRPGCRCAGHHHFVTSQRRRWLTSSRVLLLKQRLASNFECWPVAMNSTGDNKQTFIHIALQD